MASALTRRNLVKGAAASGVALSVPTVIRVAPALAKAPNGAKPCQPGAPSTRPAAVAITPDGRTLWVTDTAGTTITAVRTRDLARGRSIGVGGAPIDIAITRDGRRAFVVTAFYDRGGLSIVDLASGNIVKRADVGHEPYAVAIAGKRALVSGGGAKGTLTIIDVASGAVRGVVLLGAHPRGVAVRGNTALVALNGESAVAVVDIARARVTKKIKTASYPYRVAIAPHGRTALVTHSGLRAKKVTLIDLVAGRARRSLSVGADPYTVGFNRDGYAAIITDNGADAVTLVDLLTGLKRVVGILHRPRGLAIAGNKAYVVNEFEGTVSAIRLPAPVPHVKRVPKAHA